MTTKLIENIDDEVWNKFAGLCKIKDKPMGEMLNHILEKELKREGIK